MMPTRINEDTYQSSQRAQCAHVSRWGELREGAVGGWEGGEEGLDTVSCGRLEVFFEVGAVCGGGG